MTNNSNAQSYINNCASELKEIKNLIDGLGHLSKPIPYLTKYAVIKSCGTIESCFKTIISDIHADQSPQIQCYIDKTIRESSMNPNQENIGKTLKRFDIKWFHAYKRKLNEHTKSHELKDSLRSLNEARNTFAHGGSITQTFQQIEKYFNDSVEIIKIIDEVVNQKI